MYLKDVIEEFLLELDIRGYSNETIRSYSNALKAFSEYMGDIKIVDIKSIHIKGFSKFNKDRTLKQKSQNGYISAIRALYTYLVEEEIVSKNLGFSVKLVHAKDKKEIHVFTSDEIKRLINYTKSGTQKYNKYLIARDNLILNFLIETGCRNHELVNLKPENIEDGYIFFKVTKNSKPRVVPISKQLKKQMMRYERIKKQYFKKSNKEDVIDMFYFLSRSGNKLHTVNIGQVVKKACNSLNIDSYKAYPHNFRHTFAVNMLKNTNDIYLVSKLLGHCNVSITEEYLRGLTKLDILEMSKGYSVLENL